MASEFVSWMNGTQVDPASPAFMIGAGFEAIGSGDFNGDGMADIVWYRAGDQLLYIQFIDGATALPDPPSGLAGQIGGGWELRGLGVP